MERASTLYVIWVVHNKSVTLTYVVGLDEIELLHKSNDLAGTFWLIGL
ncbi:hypothetical protein KQH60_07840 [Mycetohabitans sp. B8]|nr:hypothetical protein [Mycetohabitans sp. B8]MCG1042464.1 hypothetical protein [Mycetohabitans sp. B8]